MPVELRETRLPGIGVKYGFRTSEGGRLAIVLHNDGVREIYFFRHDHDDEPSEVIRLDDDEARQLGAVIGGAYERPKIVEWVPVPDDSPLIGQTLAECGFRAKTGITVIAILRDPEPVAGAQPSDVVNKGDTLVTVGKLGQYQAFHKLLAEGTL
jgi:TrkA domain protein